MQSSTFQGPELALSSFFPPSLFSLVKILHKFVSCIFSLFPSLHPSVPKCRIAQQRAFSLLIGQVSLSQEQKQSKYREKLLRCSTYLCTACPVSWGICSSCHSLCCSQNSSVWKCKMAAVWKESCNALKSQKTKWYRIWQVLNLQNWRLLLFSSELIQSPYFNSVLQIKQSYWSTHPLQENYISLSSRSN